MELDEKRMWSAKITRKMSGTIDVEVEALSKEEAKSKVKQNMLAGMYEQELIQAMFDNVADDELTVEIMDANTGIVQDMDKMRELINNYCYDRCIRRDLPTCRCGLPAVMMKCKDGRFFIACKAWVDQEIPKSMSGVSHSVGCMFNTENDAVYNWKKYVGRQYA